MYLDGVGPNSSIDCFGFVTVQMTFNGAFGWKSPGEGLGKKERGTGRSDLSELICERDADVCLFVCVCVF